MKRALLRLLPAFMLCMNVFSQEEAAIQKWQSAHPTTLLISAERYAGFTEEEKALIGTDFILFQDKVTIELLQKSEQSKSTGNIATLKEQDEQIIKDWLGSHQQVKIVKRSSFDAFAPERQQYCLERPLEILILEGETITVKDIESYGQ